MSSRKTNKRLYENDGSVCYSDKYESFRTEPNATAPKKTKLFDEEDSSIVHDRVIDDYDYEINNEFEKYVKTLQSYETPITCGRDIEIDHDRKDQSKDSIAHEVILRIHHPTTDQDVKPFIDTFTNDTILSKYIHDWKSKIVESKWIVWEIKCIIPSAMVNSVVRRLCVLYTISTWYTWKNIPQLCYVDYCVNTMYKTETIIHSCFVQLTPMKIL